MKIPLSKRFQFEDYDITEINLDFDSAPANVLIKADRRMTQMKHTPQIKQMDSTYCAVVASYVSGIPYEVLLELPLRDFNLVTNAISGFLLTGEEAVTEEAISPQNSGG